MMDTPTKISKLRAGLASWRAAHPDWRTQLGAKLHARHVRAAETTAKLAALERQVADLSYRTAPASVAPATRLRVSVIAYDSTGHYCKGQCASFRVEGDHWSAAGLRDALWSAVQTAAREHAPQSAPPGLTVRW